MFVEDASDTVSYEAITRSAALFVGVPEATRTFASASRLNGSGQRR